MTQYKSRANKSHTRETALGRSLLAPPAAARAGAAPPVCPAAHSIGEDRVTEEERARAGEGDRESARGGRSGAAAAAVAASVAGAPSERAAPDRTG